MLLYKEYNFLTAIAEIKESDSEARRDMEIPSCKF